MNSPIVNKCAWYFITQTLYAIENDGYFNSTLEGLVGNGNPANATWLQTMSIRK
jgi:hypothetical protein